MAGYSITIEGLEEVNEMLKGLAKTDFTDALTRLGLDMERDAKRNISEVGAVDSGALKRSITFEAKPNELNVGTNLEYAPYVEFGTGIYTPTSGAKKIPWVVPMADGTFFTTYGMPARPFMAKTYQRFSPRVASYIIEDLFKGR